MASANVVFSSVSGNLPLMDGDRITSAAVASGAASTAAPSGTVVARITPIGAPLYVAFSTGTPDPSTNPRVYVPADCPLEVFLPSGYKVGVLDV